MHGDRILVALNGPTAVGKTATAIQLAKSFGTGIISCDSRQMYREMVIGTAVPTPEEQAAVPHYFLGNLSIHDYYNVSKFEEEALALLEELFDRSPVVVLTGGSGLYMDALCRGMDEFPEVDPGIRTQVEQIYHTHGLEELRRQLRLSDPLHFERMDNLNPQRVMKALEVCLQTGKPYSFFLRGTPKPRPFTVLKAGLNLPREELYQRIDNRVDRMLEQGLLQEAQALYPHRKCNALKTVGYRELFAYLEGRIPLEEAIRLIKRNTRHYAK